MSLLVSLEQQQQATFYIMVFNLLCLLRKENPNVVKVRTSFNYAYRQLCFFFPFSLLGSWDDVFKVSVGLYLVGTVVWNLFSTGEKILD